MENMNNNPAMKANSTRPDLQTSFYGLHTSSLPYLLVQHSPYLLNFKFNDSGQGLTRRDGHKVYKDYKVASEKIVASTQALNSDIYYIVRGSSTGYLELHNFVKYRLSHKEHVISISSLVTMDATDKIDNLDVITGFGTSGGVNVFIYFNVVKPDGTKTKVFLQTDKTLSSVAVNSTITVTGVSASPIPIVTHAEFNQRLFAIVEKTKDNYFLVWGDKNAVALDKSAQIPNDDEVYAIKSFADAVYIFCENRVYKVIIDPSAGTVTIEINSEGYGITSNKLIKAIGSNIFYYGQSSGLASMVGASASSILDAENTQNPSDLYVSNFHKVFTAKSICYKKDDRSLYIIGSLNCDYVSEAIHWQNWYCDKRKNKMSITNDDYINSLKQFKQEISGKNRFILEYNVYMQRFSLHYYDKEIFGHYNFIMNIPGLERHQSSEFIFTEDYVASTSSDFFDDNNIDFPVQINSIPRAKGLFGGFITSIYSLNIKYTSNFSASTGGAAFLVDCELPYPLTYKGNSLKYNTSDINPLPERNSNVIQIRKSTSGINPSKLIGFSSKDILIFEGFQINSEMSAMKTI